jgi:PAS domain S-box-containing protein
LLSANNFFCELLGYSQIELADMNIFALIDPQDIGALRNRFRQCYGNGERSSAITTRFHHKNGRKVWCEVTAATEWSAHGEERQVLLIISDSTAQKASELAQLELASYLRRAQRAEGIGQRAGEMVHDFNNLLFVILENLELLERKLAPEGDGLNLTRRTIRAAQHGAELARTVLEFGRENTCTPKVTGPANILVAISGMLRQSLRDDIRLDIKLADHLWPVLIDAAQLESAILNLAFNARDAMPSGGTLTIEARNVIIGPSDELGAKSTLGDYLAISLSDTGTGIAPEVIAKIFDPFFTTKGTNGSGLGLSIVRTFVEASGGFVKIVSELGEGTTITLYLPSA